MSGSTEAVLIDALYLKDDVRELGDLIERTGKSLTTIYITHSHVVQRVPDAGRPAARLTHRTQEVPRGP